MINFLWRNEMQGRKIETKDPPFCRRSNLVTVCFFNINMACSTRQRRLARTFKQVHTIAIAVLLTSIISVHI